MFFFSPKYKRSEGYKWIQKELMTSRVNSMFIITQIIHHKNWHEPITMINDFWKRFTYISSTVTGFYHLNRICTLHVCISWQFFSTDTLSQPSYLKADAHNNYFIKRNLFNFLLLACLFTLCNQFRVARQFVDDQNWHFYAQSFGCNLVFGCFYFLWTVGHTDT